jgi:PKD domain
MIRTLLGLSTVAVALAFAPAAGASGWVPGPPLSPTGKVATEPHLVVTPDGGRVVAWAQNAPDGFTVENVSVRSAPPGGDFGPTTTFKDPGNFPELQLAAGADGTVALAWLDANTNAIHIARRAPGQTEFLQATPVSPTAETIERLDLAVSQGDAYVAFDSFKQSSANPSSIWAARLAAGGNTVTLLPGTAAGGALDHVAFAGGTPAKFVDGSTIAVDGAQTQVSWEQRVDGTGNVRGTTTIESAARTDASFGATAQLGVITAGGPTAQGVQVASAAGGGHTYVLWDQLSRVVFRDLARGNMAFEIAADANFEGDLHAAVDDAGTLYAAWAADPPNLNGALIDGAIVPASSNSPVATRLTTAGPARQLDDLAVASDGTALALSDHTTSSFDTGVQLDGLFRPAGGSFGTHEDTTGFQDGTRFVFHTGSAAVAPGGRALTAWSASSHDGSRDQLIHVSERDTTAPAFGDISVPQTATVGSPAAFTASASDDLSGASVSWDFGDGSEGDGQQVTHTFGTAGAATVTVTATDGVGNTVRKTRVVAVQPAPVAAGPGPDTRAPSVSGLALTHRRFRVTKNGVAQIAAAKRAPAGTTVRLSLSERATLVIVIAHGRTVRGTLVRASSGPGSVRVPFSGRIAGGALRPGSYTASVTAIDGSGNRSKPDRVKFTVVKK